MALIGDGRGGVFCENSLVPPEEWSQSTQTKVGLGTFDLVLTNPPFGSKISIRGGSILSQYELGYKWKRNKKTKRFSTTTQIESKRPPQLLFLERCLQLLKPGGRMGIVLPESILGNPSYEFIIEFMRANATILGVVTMPEPLFKTSGKGGTHTKVAVLFLRKEVNPAAHDIYMADLKWCGHDSRGNPTLRKDVTGVVSLLDEIPLVPQRYRELRSGITKRRDHLGYLLSASDIRNQILVPKYYDPEIDAAVDELRPSHRLVTLDDLVKKRIVSLSTGVEPGKMAYGTGDIPFIRTSDLSNWEFKADFKHGVSEAIYQEYRAGADVKAGDILIVRDGTYLIGTSAIVTDIDLPMLFQSHLVRLRVLKPNEVNPWLLFACLNTLVVKRQIRAKQFTQDIIDTLGKRLSEVIIPFPKDVRLAKRVADEVKNMIETKARMRERAKAIALELQGVKSPKKEDLVALEAV
jgi:type I restriction enzyme M protein